MIKLFTLIAVTSFVLVGCGGGGSGGSESSQAPITNSGAGTDSSDASGSSSSADDSSGNDSSSDDSSSDTTLLLNNLATNIFIPNYTNVANSAGALASESGALEAYCSSIGTTDEATALSNAQSAWRDVMADVQATELHAVGPAIANGETLRKRMLSFSDGALSTCGIDEIAVLASETDFSISTVSYTHLRAHET